jgi:20S proteasome subunit alpha 5
MRLTYHQHILAGGASVPGRILARSHQAGVDRHWSMLLSSAHNFKTDETQVATSKGVLLGVEKRVTSPLLVSSSIEKIVEIDRHIGCAMSGLQADARSMIEHARVESQNHAFHYNEQLGVESCTQAICDLALRFGEGAQGEESIMSRPFGVALLIAGWDADNGPQL